MPPAAGRSKTIQHQGDNVSANIHPTAIIDSSAEIGSDVIIGPYCVIEKDVVVGDRTELHSHIVLMSGTRIGRDCKVSPGAVLGNVPQDLKFGGEESELIIGDRTTIREFCTLNRGTEHGGSTTRVGSDCLLMAYSHVAHDCSVGDNVILANGVNMAGHVVIEDNVGISGLTVIHQFTHIGQYAYIGGGSKVSQDVPPYILTSSDPLAYYGPNSVGLRRKGFTGAQISEIKRAYHYIYRTKLNLSQAIEAIKTELSESEVVKNILTFIERSERGLIGR